MAKTLTQIGIETGNIVEAYHVTQSIDAFTGTDAYNIFLSGSFNMTGSINGEPGVINPLTASYAITASHALTASYAVSASYEINYETSSSYADTASYVSLIAGPNITINQVGSSFEISGSAGGGGVTPSETGSFYYSSSVDLNTITFYQGDGTTESVTVDTGSANVGTYKVITDTNPGTGVTSVAPTYNTIKVVTIPANTFTTGDIVKIYVIYAYPSVTTQAGAAKAYISTSAGSHTGGGTKQIYGEADSDYINLQVGWGMSVVRNLHVSASNQTTWLAAQVGIQINNDETYNSLSSVGPSFGYVTADVDWTVNQYIHFRAAFQGSSGGTINIKFVKITN